MSLDRIDLRSDTVTLPTEAMREAMYRAEVGDSMRGEDPTVNRLEELAAEMLGKEAALFVASGTMGNLVAMLTHAQRGDEVLFEAETHAYYYEVGAFGALGGLAARTINGRYGVMAPEAIEEAIRPASLFYPRPRLLVLENTHNRGGGNAIPVETLAAMAEVARRHGMAVHLDGARIFNAALALGVPTRDIAAVADSVQICLTKGLSAPFGSLVLGTREFISRAAKTRKMVGGDLRQAGVVAAAGIVALQSMVDRLIEDHRNAALLAEGLRGIAGLTVDQPPNPTNMVFIDTRPSKRTAAEIVARLAEGGVLASAHNTYRIRLVLHRHITSADVERAVEVFRHVFSTVPAPVS